MENKPIVYFKQSRADGSVTAIFEQIKQVEDLPTFLNSAPPHTAMLIAYREDQWDAMRAAAADRDELHSTWQEWDEEGKKHLAQFEARGIEYAWMPFDVEECQKYCQKRNVPNNSENRMHFARLQYEAAHPGVAGKLQ